MKAAVCLQFLGDAKERGRKDLAPQILLLLSDRAPNRSEVVSTLDDLEVPEALIAAHVARGDTNPWVWDYAIENIGIKSDLHRV